jgi:guanylate kinase
VAKVLNPYEHVAKPQLIVISGPSGVGKDATIRRMQELGYPFHFVVTATDRPKRPNEADGIDYFFITNAEFEKMVEQGELLEYAIVYGHYKGIPKQQVRQAISSGRDVILRIDVQGAETIRKLVPAATLIFLIAESEEALLRRLSERKTESEDELQTRFATARLELSRLELFDYVVINADGQLDDTCRRIAAIIAAEHCRIPQPDISL